MENKNIIVILLIVIAALVIINGLMFSHSNSKEQTKIEINQTNLTVDDNMVTIKLLDSKGELLKNQSIDVIIKDGDGFIVFGKENIPFEQGYDDFDYDLEKGKYLINVSYHGNENYSASNITYKLKINDVAPTYTEEELIEMEYPQYSSVFGHYREIESHDELALIETYTGEQYVLAGDGYYTFGGYDSQGIIQFGEYVGKY